MIYKHLLAACFAFLVLLSLPIYAQTAETEELPNKHLDQKQWQKLADNLEFEVQEELELNIEPLAGTEMALSEAVKNAIGILLLAVVIGIVVYFLLKGNLLKRQKKQKIASFSLKQENIDTIDFEDLQQQLAEALAQANYRLAIRFYFLIAFKHLCEQGHLQWQKNKTNSDYTYELYNTDMYADFRRLVFYFEKAFYADRFFTKADFHEAEPIFKKFIKHK
ncbi:MAG: hypothetical protein JJT94_08850 [Bernardetiaceae bacterium]|nr:hypothetical protein [Bernardetiaceae bacterium]